MTAQAISRALSIPWTTFLALLLVSPWSHQAWQVLPGAPGWSPVATMPQVLPGGAVAHAVPALAYSQGPAPLCGHHVLRPPLGHPPAAPLRTGDASSPGSPMGPVNSTAFKTPSIMFTSLLGTAVVS